MGWKLEKTEEFRLETREEVLDLARRLSEYGATDCERVEKKAHMAKIKRKILEGRMLPFTWRIARVLGTEIVRRVDGQHSADSFLALDAAEWAQVQFPVMVYWQEYLCDTKTDLADLFENFDPAWSMRTTTDIMGVHLGLEDGLGKKVRPDVAVKLAKEILWHRSSVQGGAVWHGSHYDIVHESPDSSDVQACLSSFGTFLHLKKTSEMFKPHLLGAAYHTYHAVGEESSPFWREVAAGKLHCEDGSVSYRLAEFLEELNDSTYDWPKYVNKGKGPTEIDVFATGLRAFWHFQKRKPLSQVYTPAKGRKAREIAVEYELRPSRLAV